jgi:hypothetical protein
MSRFLAVRVVVGFACLLIPVSLLASADPDRTQFNHDIHIGPNDKVGDVTCIGCSVHVRGQVSGDVTTIAGSVFLEQGASIAGDVTVLGGNTRAESGTQVAGDLTAIGGDLVRDPQAAVAGDVTTVGGGRWVFLIFLAPFLILGGIIALIIWLVQRSRHPAAVPAYTLRRN